MSRVSKRRYAVEVIAAGTAGWGLGLLFQWIFGFSDGWRYVVTGACCLVTSPLSTLLRGVV